MESRRRVENQNHEQAAGRTGDDPDGLLSSVARGLTSTLVQSRNVATWFVTGAGSRASRVVGGLRDLSDDALAYLDPGPWLEEVYATLGIASTGALGELDERIDEIELKVDEAARRRAREELLLLQERIAALEDVLEARGVGTVDAAVGKLLGRLSELEDRIDALPWPRIDEDVHPTA